MKLLSNLDTAHWAKLAARGMRVICLLVVAFFVLGLVLGCMGRITFQLRTATETYDRAIYAEANHALSTRGMTVSLPDAIYVRASDGVVGLPTQISLVLMYALHVVPLIFAYWFLSRVCENVSEGRIFTGENASYLLRYGLLQVFVALPVPFLKLLICQLSNLVSVSQMAISTGSHMMNDLFTGVAFLIAAYILHHGVHLQDEVDHTL